MNVWTKLGYLLGGPCDHARCWVEDLVLLGMLASIVTSALVGFGVWRWHRGNRCP